MFHISAFSCTIIETRHIFQKFQKFRSGILKFPKILNHELFVNSYFQFLAIQSNSIFTCSERRYLHLLDNSL